MISAFLVWFSIFTGNINISLGKQFQGKLLAGFLRFSTLVSYFYSIFDKEMLQVVVTVP